MTEPERPHRVLVPVEILRGEAVPETLVEVLSSVPVVLLGYHEVPEQTAPGQARMQFEEKAQRELDELVGAFEDAGGTVATRLVFTHDSMKTFERIAAELECDAVVLLNPAPRLERVLLPLRGDLIATPITRLVGAILAGNDAQVTLFHVSATEDEQSEARALLDDATAMLEAEGIAADRINRSTVVADTPLETIVEVADDHDFIIMGESQPSIRDRVFGNPSTTVAAQTVNPVLVVRRRFLEMDADEREDRVDDLEETADEFDDSRTGAVDANNNSNNDDGDDADRH
ncbi:universal stress protein [Natrialbaceae archaeon A-CW3]